MTESGEEGQRLLGGVQGLSDRDLRVCLPHRVAYGTETTRAWFYGTNTQLKDEAPASVLRKAPEIEQLQAVYEAARIFIGQA